MSRYLLRAVQDSRIIKDIDTAIFATPLQETLDMIAEHQELREETNVADIAKWKKIEERYQR
eukprot:12390182-Karenia_brevis.AAC.1